MSAFPPRSRTAALFLSVGAGAAIAQPANNWVETIVVTGTRLGRTAGQSFQQVRTYDRARIDASGQSTVAGFLATVPEVSINSLESTFGATSVRLRGACAKVHQLFRDERNDRGRRRFRSSREGTTTKSVTAIPACPVHSGSAAFCALLCACVASAQPAAEAVETLVVTGRRLTAEYSFQEVRTYERARITTMADLLGRTTLVRLQQEF